MLYRITIDLSFPTEAPQIALLQHALAHFPGAVTINPGLPQEEQGHIITQKCYHDEDLARPCQIIEELTTPN